MLQFLLDAGCEANIKDDAGRTPLMIAVYLGLHECLELLFHAGCNANLQDRGGGTPVKEFISGYIPYYLEHRMDLWEERFVPTGGYTALMYAALLGDIDIVEDLLKYSCDTKLTNSQGQTALDLARRFGEDAVVEILLANERNEQGTLMELVD